MRIRLSAALALTLLFVAPSALAQRGERGARGPVLVAPPPPPEYTATDPSGLTAEQTGKRASTGSFDVAAHEAAVRAAAARVDEAWTTFLPRISGIARYTYLSPFTPPPYVLTGTPGEEVFTTQSQSGPVKSPTATLIAGTPALTFLPIQDNYLLQANVVIPITDYFLRLNQAFSAVTYSQEAAQYDASAAREKAEADGKVAFYTWLRARGAAVVAIQAHFDQQVHLADMRNQYGAGGASRSDVLGAEAAVAAAQLQVERAKDFADLCEEQVRLAIGAKDGERVIPAESLDEAVTPTSGSLRRMTTEALGARYEIKSIDANADAARHRAAAQRAGMFPAVSAFADAIEGNPNPRELPPQSNWLATWDAGIQLTWSTDAIGSGFAGASLERQAEVLEAQREALRNAVRVEVMQAWQTVREEDMALDVTKRQLASAVESYRAARDLFAVGKVPGSALTDAETELTRARLEALNAKADARIARVRLDHALGRKSVQKSSEASPDGQQTTE